MSELDINQKQVNCMVKIIQSYADNNVYNSIRSGIFKKSKGKLKRVNVDRAFVIAAKEGNLELVKYFLKNKAYSVEKALEVAAEGNHKLVVDFLISVGLIDWTGGFMGAARKGHLSLAKKLLDKVQKKDWNWALQGAAEGGLICMVKLLINKMTKEKINIEWGWAIQGAAKGNRPKLIDYFIKEGEKYGYKPDWNLPFCEAAKGGHLELLKSIQNKGKGKFLNFGVALEYATYEGHEDIVEYLLSEGVKLNMYGIIQKFGL